MSTADPARTTATIWPRLIGGRWVLTWTGWAMTFLGIAAIVAPEVGEILIGAFAGWLLWAVGAVMFGASIFLIRARPFWAGAVSSLFAIAAGVYLLLNPKAGALAATLLAFAALIIDGAFQLALAFDLRPIKVWRWVLASSIASVLAALVLYFGVPVGATGGFGVAVGFAVLTTGLAFILLGDAAAKAPERPRR